jgi:hypothetical protein
VTVPEAVRSFAKISLGLRFFRHLVITSLPAHGTVDRQAHWIRISKAGQTHKACSTAAKPLPALHIASASRSFAAISSGRCFFRRLVIESLFAHWVVDLHTDWIRISKAGHENLMAIICARQATNT